MTLNQRLLDGDIEIESNSKKKWGRAWHEKLRWALGAERRAVRVQRGKEESTDNRQGETLPMHTGWLFTECEPPIADLVHRIDMLLSGREKRVLQFIGADRSVGTSTVAFAYASASAALRQRRVLLLSADERRAAPDVLTCVSEGRPVSDAVSTVHGLLSYATLTGDCGNDRDAERLMAEAEVWRKIREGFDEVVVDCRPVDVCVGALAIASRADGVVVVIQSIRTLEICAKALLDSLGAVNTTVLGAVLNQGMAEWPFGSRGDDE